MKWFALTSIKKRLLAIYLPLIIFPSIVIFIVAYYLFSVEMDRASHRHTKQTVEVINRHLETYLDELDRLSLFPYFHNDVMEILRNNNQFTSPEESYQEYKLFNDMFDNIMLNPRRDMLNVTLYREDGKRYFNTRVYVSLNTNYEWKNSDWYQRTLKANGEVVYTLNSGKDGRFTALDHTIFSISRLVKSENGEILGAILIDANFQGITEILKAVGLGKNANVVLRDANDKIIYSQNQQYLNEIQSAHTDETKKLIIGGETLFMESHLSEKTGWTVSVILPSDEISNSFFSIRGIILLMIALIVLITFFITFWFSESLTRPIRELHRKMKMVEGGDYDVIIEMRREDEIGSLGKAFNRMIFQIKGLIQEVYEFNIRQKEAELNNLKMQIRPHFLYNTLEAIRALADIHDNEDVVEMTTSLGSILRYSIKTPQTLVHIDKEIDYMRQYINIQQIMLGDSFRVEYDIDKAILYYYSIPLLFQPIIENAFQHGLYGKRQNGLIRVIGKREGGDLHFIISDNGKGISLEQLEIINNKLMFPNQVQETSVPMGIGFTNVNQRIKIVFGEEYGLFLEQNPEGGTLVHIKFPIVDKDNKPDKAGKR
jgi:two-component system, sensor histidine kinase YesM